MSGKIQPTRRHVLETGIAAGAMTLFARQIDAAESFEPARNVPIPAQAPVTEGLAELPGTKLWYWDTGGQGVPVVLMHPASVSSEVWLYQQPMFATGYRVIAYSRRGYIRSDPVPATDPGHASQDLGNLLDFLNVGRCHIVASAAGCQVSMDFALSHPERIRSLTLSSGTGGVSDAEYSETLEHIRPVGFDDYPVEFRELSPAYRASNPEGAARWKAISEAAVTGERRGQTNVNQIVWAAVERLNLPVLLIGGDADLYMPPPVMREFLSHLQNGELNIVPEAGHSSYWEQPEIFNRTVLNFLSRNGLER
jgi:pimeloyl-ACP methyl ester carboxylesterase